MDREDRHAIGNLVPADGAPPDLVASMLDVTLVGQLQHAASSPFHQEVGGNRSTRAAAEHGAWRTLELPPTGRLRAPYVGDDGVGPNDDPAVSIRRAGVSSSDAYGPFTPVN